MADNLLRTALEESLHEKRLIGLHCDPVEPTHFSIGWLTALTDDSYVIASIDEIGRADEFKAGLLEDVFLVVTGGEYLDAISRLMIDHLSQWKDTSLYGSDMSEVLTWATQSGEVINLLHRNGETYRGIVRDVDRSHVALDAYNTIGKSEGRHILEKAHLSRIAFAGPDQRALAQLIQAQTSGR